MAPRAGPGQLSLFATASSLPALLAEDAHALAKALPPRVHLGTSSWTFPGWEGLVYPQGVSARDLGERGLSLYVRCPLFRTVGIDRTFYSPLPVQAWRRYAAELPPRFPCVVKAWSELTTATLRGGAPNPRFLDADSFLRDVVEPLEEGFRDHVGALVLQLSPLRGSALAERGRVLERMHRLLSRARCDLPLAVELRNPELATEEWACMLRESGALLCLGLSEQSPALAAQAALPGVLQAERIVLRLSLPRGRRYEEQKERFAPFRERLEPRPEILEEVVRIVAATEARGSVVLVVVNNKLEGSSPLTVEALARRLARG